MDRVALRSGAALLLSYGAGSAASVVLAAVLPMVTPLPLAGAVMTGTMLGYVLMVPVVLWCFATARIWRTVAIITAGSLLATLLGLLAGSRL